jgi:hypothetical protein
MVGEIKLGLRYVARFIPSPKARASCKGCFGEMHTEFLDKES